MISISSELRSLRGDFRFGFTSDLRYCSQSWVHLLDLDLLRRSWIHLLDLEFYPSELDSTLGFEIFSFRVAFASP